MKTFKELKREVYAEDPELEPRVAEELEALTTTLDCESVTVQQEE